MANKRMFSNTITTSARFLKLPPTAQLLYFHLGMRADDDGVVEAFTVIRYAGVEESDLELLEQRGFVKVLNEDLVTYITDWSENNNLRSDRKRDSIYKDLLENIDSAGNCPTNDGQMTGNCRANDGQVTDKCQASDGQMTGNCPTNDRVGKYSIGKDSIDKDSLGEDKARARFVPPTLEEVKAYCQERQNNVNPDKFISHYQSNGWMVGKSKMKDWRAAVRTWEHNGFDNKGKAPPGNELEDFYNFANEWAESGE